MAVAGSEGQTDAACPRTHQISTEATTSRCLSIWTRRPASGRLTLCGIVTNETRSSSWGARGTHPPNSYSLFGRRHSASRMRPSAACFDHSVFSRFRVAPADACCSHCFCHHGVDMCGRAGDTKSSSLRRRGGTRSYGAGRAATVPSRTKPSGISWVAPTLHTGTQ